MNAHSLLAQYRSWLLNASSVDDTTPCIDITLLEQVRRSILQEPDLHNALQNDAFPLITSGLWDKCDVLPALKRMADAFQTLEQAALLLYFTPWRKEFHSIKTYSGHYVHVLGAAFPQDGIFQALGKLGYVPQEDGSYLTLCAQPSPDALSRTALGFMAAQMECQILADLVSCLGSSLVNGADLIQERKIWRGEEACMERLQKMVQAPSQISRSPEKTDLYRSGLSQDGAAYHPLFCDHCHEAWDRHVNGCCREITECLVRPCSENVVQPVEDNGLSLHDFYMHDCVFSDKSLEQSCATCRHFHSSICPALRRCKKLAHPITQLTPSMKQEAVIEENERRYQLHLCLKPGQLPHYRCAQCRELHYINCKGLMQCRNQGHNATMIMLEKHQELWLQRSLMDLSQLCLDQVPIRGTEV
ncbi:spermatogenesis-associated protein 2-like protein [Gastrophryne carolinensis]